MAFLGVLATHLRAVPERIKLDLFAPPKSDESPAVRLRRAFVYHLFPIKVTERALLFRTTLGLGLAGLTLFLLLTATGFLLMVYYVPTPQDAYASMLDLEHAVTFGALVRRLHRFAAHAMVAMVALHVVRILAQAAYRRRELNWTIGLSLGALTVALSFTGYLLPWDQQAYWAVRVVTEMLGSFPGLGPFVRSILLGGDSVGGATLVRFYALHVAILPAALLAFVVLHLWRIRKDGGLATSSRELPTLPAWPYLTGRVGAAMLFVAALVLVWDSQGSSLGPPADVLRPDNPEKAPWYFLGLQELVSYSVVAGGFVFPGVASLLLFVTPFLDREDDQVGVWLGSAESRRSFALHVVVAGAVILGLTLGLAHPAATPWLAGQPTWLADLVNPAALTLVWAATLFFFVGARSGSLRSALRAALLALGLALVLFTVLGLCRGPDWTLPGPFTR